MKRENSPELREALANLRGILANFYPDESSIRMIADDAGIDLTRVALNATSINN